MIAPPNDIWVYHITHVDNLPAILQSGGLWSDSEMCKQNAAHTIIGDSNIKRRRLTELPVSCYPTTKVGEYVPFYFCPRSPMLYKIAMNNRELAYRGGQQQIVHLRARILDMIEFATAEQRVWAFSTSNAGAYTADFFNSMEDITRIRWDIIESDKWSGARMSLKMAEFLVHKHVPICQLTHVGCHNDSVVEQVQEICTQSNWEPMVSTERSWYY